MDQQRIVIVDDEIRMCESLAFLLSGRGFHITCFTDGRQALSHIRNQGCDLVLLDLIMPEIDGFMVLNRIKENHPDVQVIIVTAQDSTDYAVKAIKEGADDYLCKPFEIDKLIKRIQNTLNAQHLARQNAIMEEKYRNLYNHSVLGIFHSTLEGTFMDVNPSLARMMGYDSPEEVIRCITDISAQVYAEPPKRDAVAAKALEGGGFVSAENCYRRKDGTLWYGRLHLRIVYDHQGRPNHYEGFIEDITGSKQAEEEKYRLEERLQRAEKMEALGLLAGGVAHDLNNVLGIVVGYSEMLLSETAESNPMKKDLLNIMNGGQKAAAIVQDLLTLARRGVSGRKVLNLNRLILDFNRSPEAEKLLSIHHFVRVRTDLEADLLNISASAVHVEKTLFNLMSNAVEAMPDGGDVTIRTKNQYLDKPVRGYDHIHEGDYVVLSVSDMGKGIRAADMKRIFEPFYTKKIMGRSGTGLGLAVVWGTVKDHQGYINVESGDEKGTVFTLYFPVAREEVAVESLPLSSYEYMGRGESILVIDDVKGQRDLATAMLEKLNYKVVSVSSGEDAVDYLKEHKVDLLVLDMIMDPGMDGLDTYRCVLGIHPGQKAIIVSGFSESDRVNAAYELGAGAYVKKPYVLEKLGLAVRQALDHE